MGQGQEIHARNLMNNFMANVRVALHVTHTACLGRLFDRVDLIKPVLNVHPSVRMYVRTCVRTAVRPSTKSFFDFNEIWHVSRGRWVMHDGMQYDPIQGQGHEPFKVGNPAILKSYLLRSAVYNGSWQLTTDP